MCSGAMTVAPCNKKTYTAAVRARAVSRFLVITPLPVQVLRRRCEHELGSDGFELLHSLCLANGGQLTRPLDLEVRHSVT